jgi:hypothetical protein
MEMPHLKKRNDWAENLSLDNLVPYTHPSAAWSDRHSYIALSWEQPEEIGLQRAEALIGWGGTKLTDQLLKWEVRENNTPLPLQQVKRTYRPDQVIEQDTSPGIDLTVTAAYIKRNALAVQFEITNTGSTHRDFMIDFVYPGKNIEPDWKGTYPLPSLSERQFFAPAPGHVVSLQGEPPGSWSTLFWHMEHGRNITWVRDYVSGIPNTSMEMVCLSDLTARIISLASGETTDFTVLLAFGLNRGQASRLYAKCQEKIAKGWTPAEETRRIRKLLNTAPPLPAKYGGNETYERMYAHAITGLNSLFIRGDSWLTGKKRLPWTTKDALAIAFYWDTAFSCLGASEFNLQACREALEAFTDNTSPRGGLPGTLCATHRAGEGQAPVMAWSAWTVYRREKDAAWLRRVYPALSGYYHFWMKYHSSSRGIPLYYNAGQAGDNDVRWDPVYGREMGNEPLSGVEPPDLSAFFVTELRCLAKMAIELGLTGEASTWEHEADTLAQKVVEFFYFPEEAMFYDVYECTHDKFSGAKGPFLFIPLRAQVPLPAEEVKRIVEEHMLNPNEFFKTLPFPSVSYDHPKYDPNGYWRGRIWPHVVYWMIQTLWVSGYHAQAEETADRLLAMFQSTPWIYENYNSGSGEGWDPNKQIGFPDYNWSFSTLILILLERYKEPLF